VVRERAGRGKYGYMDTTGAWKIRPKFVRAGSFVGGRAAVSIDAKYLITGYIDKAGKFVWRRELRESGRRPSPEASAIAEPADR